MWFCWLNNFLAFHVTKIALLVIGFLGCIVWGHHTFMVGFDINTRAHYTSVTSIIAIPTGMKILNRLSSIWSGCTWFTTTLSWIIGFVYASSSGGSSGLVLANVILDVLPHDTYFVVSHSHHVSSLGAVYTIYAAFYNYWMILSSYFCFHDLIGRIHFMWFFYNDIYFIFATDILFINQHIFYNEQRNTMLNSVFSDLIIFNWCNHMFFSYVVLCSYNLFTAVNSIISLVTLFHILVLFKISISYLCLHVTNILYLLDLSSLNVKNIICYILYAGWNN